ncbi:hypothetical protein AOQ84DRAFT_377129 [Glonium stellatum]|uniref:Uncharacterized protein n=1 Tax=Glonium stellatum TaxID=574774 RepID=A0A8E2F077_9PEZI|nr:hypothetical protein AOQ84DRAFT_377129 [Glonium stellatum]
MANGPLRLLENITLLRKINPEPGRPGENNLPCLERDGRALKLRHERAIADCLAFVSTYSNDPNRILALCIEEKSNRQGLIVSVAVNAGDLNALTTGIHGITSVLEIAARDSLQDNYTALLRQIARHGRSRLLRRLSSKHTPSKRPLRAPVAARLKDALAVFHKTCKNMAEVNQSLRSLSCQFEDQFNRLEQMPVSDARSNPSEQLLISMLTTANSIWTRHRDDLVKIMEQIPCEHSWVQNDKEKFMLRLRKLAHYVSATNHLLEAAYTFPILRSIEVRGVSIAPLPLAIHLQRKMTLPSTGLLNQYLNGHRAVELKATMTKLKQQSQHSLLALQSEVRNRVCEIKYKIHAEIQLLFHYEEQGNKTLKPRVIVSNKSACFLCDLFLKRHGIFHTPRTHGTLYDMWTLPDLTTLQVPQERRAELKTIVQEFGITIEQMLIHSIEAGATPRLHPNESDVFSVAPFTPSIISAASSKTVTPGNTTSTARSMVPEGENVDAPISNLSNSSSTHLYLEAIRDPPMTPQATLYNTTVLEISLGSHPPGSSSTVSSLKPDSVFSTPADDRRSPEDNSSQSPETAISPITPTTPMTQPTSLLPPLRNIKIPETPKQHEIATPEIVHLQQGVPSHRTFTRASPPLRLHTPRIHIELSYSYAQSIIAKSTEELYSCLSAESTLEVEVEWLAPKKSAIPAISSQAIDLALDWKEIGAPEGVLYDLPGLLLRKRSDFVLLRIDGSLSTSD